MVLVLCMELGIALHGLCLEFSIVLSMEIKNLCMVCMAGHGLV